MDFQEHSDAPAVEKDSASSTASMEHGLTPERRLGRYVIKGPLGAGGMGAVYRAQDETLERLVALKVVASGTFADQEARRRFRQEALALAKLSHPNIAAVYDAGNADGIDYIVMEIVAGESLAAKLKPGPMSVKESTAVLVQVAEALEEAHERGVVHRDLKPGNIMITPRGHAKVLDFGLAKLLAKATDATMSMEAGAVVGTPLYMSPEQAEGRPVDARTDLWSLGVVYYQMLTGQLPFEGGSTVSLLRAIVSDEPLPLRRVRPDAPAEAEDILSRALKKKPSQRYSSAAEMGGEGSALLASLSASSSIAVVKRRSRSMVLAVCAMLVVALAAGVWLFQRWSHRQWARDEAGPEIARLLDARRPLAALDVLEKAMRYLPDDPKLADLRSKSFGQTSIDAGPGVTVEVQDYTAPDSGWRTLGSGLIQDVLLPDAFLRWRLSRAGGNSVVEGRDLQEKMRFDPKTLDAAASGMVPVPGGEWSSNNGFNGFFGPYKLPPFEIDRSEVTNAEFQRFVDAGGYSTAKYWTERVTVASRGLAWDEEMRQFRDSTDRPGPAGWAAGHYPEGKAEYPVSGVSWFEASAYAAFAGKSLPVLAEWYRAAPLSLSDHIIPASNITGSGLARAGAFHGQGPFGTDDMVGNVREWVATADDTGRRFILGGSWRSPQYDGFLPDAISPLDRSEDNGFRCVKNEGPVPANALQPLPRASRDLSQAKPISDEVFHAYETLYSPGSSPLNAANEGLVAEAADWREEKIVFDTGYQGERMAAYLFLPKHTRPPYQTVLFAPSARVYFAGDNHDGRTLGDVKFFDYAIQSGRAVMYPIYQDTYERRVKYSLPGGTQNIQITTQRYKDAARSLDYLATRPDIDMARVAYLGVSMSAADGVIFATLLQDRLKTAVLLDGGFFMETPVSGADQANFAPRLKKPVLMVNGRYDYTFSPELAQNPLFNMLGTAPADKSHVVLETTHDVTEQRSRLVKTVLEWLNKYLGPVGA